MVLMDTPIILRHFNRISLQILIAVSLVLQFISDPTYAEKCRNSLEELSRGDSRHIVLPSAPISIAARTALTQIVKRFAESAQFFAIGIPRTTRPETLSKEGQLIRKNSPLYPAAVRHTPSGPEVLYAFDFASALKRYQQDGKTADDLNQDLVLKILQLGERSLRFLTLSEARMHFNLRNFFNLNRSKEARSVSFVRIDYRNYDSFSHNWLKSKGWNFGIEPLAQILRKSDPSNIRIQMITGEPGRFIIFRVDAPKDQASNVNAWLLPLEADEFVLSVKTVSYEDAYIHEGVLLDPSTYKSGRISVRVEFNPETITKLGMGTWPEILAAAQRTDKVGSLVEFSEAQYYYTVGLNFEGPQRESHQQLLEMLLKLRGREGIKNIRILSGGI